jgi:outer membrane protein OmpA-like peptidoglycan-associated protein
MAEEHHESGEHAPAASGPSHAHGHAGAHEEHEGAPEWLISFADNVALMMGFFVILLALNMKPATRGGHGKTPDADGEGNPSNEMLDWVIALRDAFNNPVDVNSTDPGDALLVRRLTARASQSDAHDRGKVGREHDVTSVRPGEHFVRGASIAFEANSVELDDAARRGIAELLPLLQGHRNVIEVRGHVSVAEAFPLEDRGTELSFRRAHAVAQALAAEGIPWSQIRIHACADTDRVEPRAYTETGHRLNQRVEITVTDRVVSDLVPGDDPPAGMP